MELKNDFRVSVPPSDAWKVLTDLERIAPMLPGAQLQEIDGDEYRGIVKVKVGPITAQYKGKAKFREQDESAGKVVLEASGRDARGQGNASAVITVTMRPDGDGTQVAVSTNLTITGKVAQFGRGVLADVSSKLIGQFVDTLESDLQHHGAVPAASAAAPAASAGTPATVGTEPGPDDAVPDPGISGMGALGADPSGPAASAAEIPSSGDEKPATPPASASSGPRRIDSPEVEPVDLLDAAGGSVAKRVAPLLGVGVLVALVLVWRIRKR